MVSVEPMTVSMTGIESVNPRIQLGKLV